MTRDSEPLPVVANVLTQAAIASAAPRMRPYRINDERGLYVLVTPQGKRYWRCTYRHKGRKRVGALGVWPKVSIEEARLKRDVFARLAKHKTDPLKVKRSGKMHNEIAREKMRHLEPLAVLSRVWAWFGFPSRAAAVAAMVAGDSGVDSDAVKLALDVFDALMLSKARKL